MSSFSSAMLKGQINIRMDDDDKKRLIALTKRYGTSQAGVIAMLIRDRCVKLSQEEGFDWRKPKL